MELFTLNIQGFLTRNNFFLLFLDDNDGDDDEDDDGNSDEDSSSEKDLNLMNYNHNKHVSQHNFSSSSSSSKNMGSKPARVRTVLNEKQLHTLRACYGANPRPDALMKEQLVEMTGLSPRVIRVWFQNKRCKDKKKSIMIKQMQEQQKVRSNRFFYSILIEINLFFGNIQDYTSYLFFQLFNLINIFLFFVIIAFIWFLLKLNKCENVNKQFRRNLINKIYV